MTRIDTIDTIVYNINILYDLRGHKMIFRESETVELKEVVVDDIKKKLLPLQIVMVASYILVYRMMVR